MMPVSFEYFAMEGGLDVVTPYFKMPAGRMIQCLNYECLPEGGYRRIDGYVLYDGSISPHPVPGEGEIRGVTVFRGQLHAIRDQATEGGLFRESGAGWVAIDLGYSLDFNFGVQDFIEGATVTGAGASAKIERVVFAGGSNGVGDSFGRLALSNIVGTFIDGEDLKIGPDVIAKADGSQFANSLPKGGRYSFDNGNFFGQDGLERMYGVSGEGDAFEFDGVVFATIKSAISSQYPKYIAIHKKHLFLAYRSGSLMISAPGEPLIFDAILGASEIAVGDTIHGLNRVPGGVLAVGCDDSIQMLYGNDYLSWELQPFGQHGMKPFSFGEVGGNSLVLDNRGVQNLQTTQAFGDFEAVSQSRLINPLLLNLRTDLLPTGSFVSKEKSQYRLFFGQDGYYFTYAGNQLAGITPVRYADPVLTTAAGEDAQGKEVLFFGSSDGKVFRSNRSYKYAGLPILAHFTIAFNFMRAPTSIKQLRKAMFDIKTEGDSAHILVKPDYDFGNSEVPITPYVEIVTEHSGGGIWDLSEWDAFEWAAPVNSVQPVGLMGLARNMSLTFASEGIEDGSHTIYGAAIHYSMRRLER